MLWLQFAICTSFIIASGYKLSSYADIISKRSRFPAGLMGMLVLASITSCPELVTSCASVGLLNAPDLAAGDLVGAVIMNVFVIALLGIICKKGSILTGQGISSVFTAVLTIVMLLVIITFVSLSHFVGVSLAISNISFGSILLALIYILGGVVIFRQETSTVKSSTGEDVGMPVIIKFVISAAVIIISGIWLARIGKNIADFYSWNEMHVGVILIALATTMPEFVVSFNALKKGSASMAVGNLLGSNLFNLFIIVLLDAILRRGDFFLSISALNIFPATLATILTAVALGAMIKKPARQAAPGHFSWDSILIIAIFIAGQILLFNVVYPSR